MPEERTHMLSREKDSVSAVVESVRKRLNESVPVGRPWQHAALEQADEPIDARIDKYADEAIFAMGQLLPSHFPEADSGDESPGMRMALHRAVETYAKEWLEANAPEVFER